MTTDQDVEQVFSDTGILKLLVDLKSQGVVRKIGMSCHSEDVALRALELFDFETVLFPTNWGICMGHGFGERIAEVVKKKDIGFLGMKSMIERAWNDEDESKASRFTKSWCKPFDCDDPALLPAMRFATQVLGADVIVTPGNFEHFSFAVEHQNEIFGEFTDTDQKLLRSELEKINGRYFFPPSKR